MLRLITLFLFLSCSSLDTPLSLSPVSSSRVSVTPPVCTLDDPKAWRNSVCQLLNSVCKSHWIPLCTLAPTVLLPSSGLVQVHMVHLDSKPLVRLGNFCLRLPGSDFRFPSSVFSILTPGCPVSFSLGETGMNIGATPVGGWLFGKIFAVSTRSFADCSARSLDLADCRSRDEERSARVLGGLLEPFFAPCLLLISPDASL